jgi:pseudouridine-5'-phosphate glycosidase
MLDSSLIKITPEIASALHENRPVVALESTVIAHGLPRPTNLETARRLEQTVRDGDAVPATIAILSGQLRVGLDDSELSFLAHAEDIHKVSRRDLSIAVARGWNGATTVATTMWIARQAGIQVFASGGIGGVHRGALPDVSADLPELAGNAMIVVCSGAKSVLDLPATREWLETNGVTVLGFECDEFPAFYSRRSGLPVDARVDTAAEVAEIAVARNRLGLNGATLLTVPIPTDAEIPAHELHVALEEALRDAERDRVSGRDLTPFLLSRMSELSGGATLRANIALLENNARVAADVASALSAFHKT